MVKVFFLSDYWHNATELVSTLYRAGYECEVEDEVGERAVLRGAAQFSSFAEDDLFDIDRDEDFDDEAEDE